MNYQTDTSHSRYSKLAQENIQRYQEETTANISTIAHRENESFPKYQG